MVILAFVSRGGGGATGNESGRKGNKMLKSSSTSSVWNPFYVSPLLCTLIPSFDTKFSACFGNQAHSKRLSITTNSIFSGIKKDYTSLEQFCQ